MTNTYSLHSLKKGGGNIPEFARTSKEASRGDIFHALIRYYLAGFEIENLENALNERDLAVWKIHKNSKIMEFIQNSDEKFIEQDFYIKERLKGREIWLTGRFDAVIRNGENFTIMDWKTNALPKTPEKELQTIIYTHAAAKLFKTENIEMIYYSLEKQTRMTARYNPSAIFESVDF